jgi:hypothetical protein
LSTLPTLFDGRGCVDDTTVDDTTVDDTTVDDDTTADDTCDGAYDPLFYYTAFFAHHLPNAHHLADTHHLPTTLPTPRPGTPEIGSAGQFVGPPVCAGMRPTELAQPSSVDVETPFQLLQACTPPKSSGSLVGAGYSPAAHRKLKTKVDKYGRTNSRVKAAIASYRLLCDGGHQQDICGYVDLYLDERSATLAAAFKEHAKLHVSVNFNTRCGGNKTRQGRKCPNCLFKDVESIFKVVMQHVQSKAVEDETLEPWRSLGNSTSSTWWLWHQV